MDEGADELLRSLFARMIAEEAITDALMTAVLAAYPPEVRQAMFALLREKANNVGPSGNMPDVAAEFWADVRVKAASQLEKRLAALEGTLPKVQAPHRT